MSITEDPPFIFRFALVYTLLPGASPEQVDRLVTGPLEEVILELPELEYTESFSREGISLISVKLDDRYDNVIPIWEELRRKIEGVQPELPPGHIGPVVDAEFGEIFGILIGVSSSTLSFEALQAQAQAMQEDLLLLSQVSQVTMVGQREEQIQVELDLESMSISGVSPFAIAPAIAGRSQIIPGGRVPLGSGETMLLNPSGDIRDLDDLRDTPIPLVDEVVTLPLSDVAQVSKVLEDPPTEMVSIEGQPGLLLGVSLQKKGNIRLLGREIKQQIAYWETEYGKTVDFEIVTFEPGRIDATLGGLLKNLIQSLCIVLLILVLVLGLREGIVVAALIPLAILLSFCIMALLGLTVNYVAVGGFIVVLGMLVDNNIVVAERIVRHRHEGLDPVRSATMATGELHMPLITSALTTMVAFLPIFLAETAAGEYASPLFLVVAIGLVSAEIIVFTVTPLMSCHFFRSPEALSQIHGNVKSHKHYRRWLQAILSRPRTGVVLVCILVVLSAVGFILLPKNFFPPSDRPILAAEFYLPPGTGIEETAQVGRQIDAFISEKLRPDFNIQSWATFAGRNAPRFVLNHRAKLASPDYGYILFDLKDLRQLEALQAELEAFGDRVLTGVSFRVRPLEVGPAIGFPIQVRLKGSSIDGLRTVSEEVMDYFRGVEGLTHVGSEWGEPVPHFQLDVDYERAAEYGFTQSDLAAAIQVKVNGLEIGKFLTEDGTFPIVLTLPETVEVEPRSILEWNLVSPETHEVITLGDLADLEEIEVLTTIARHTGQRSLTIWADLEGDVSSQSMDDRLRPWLEARQASWLETYGVDFEVWGEGRQAVVANESLINKIPIALLIILVLLLKQTRSFRRTFIVLLAVPLGLIGAIAGMVVLQQPFGFMSLVGVVSLSGIVVNSAILLLNRIRLNVESGDLSERECILEAADQRYRAIVLTTVTTVGGMLPLFFFGGPFWRPMTTALIFGLSFATILILFIVPLAYSILYRIDFRDQPGVVSEN